MLLKCSSIKIVTEKQAYWVRLVGRMEKWEDRKDFIFPHLCLVGRVENGGMENFFVWLKMKFV